MADNLTLQLKQELARRGKVVTDAQIESFLKTKNSLSQVQQQPQQ